MSTLADVVTRTRHALQDLDAVQAWQDAQITAALDASIMALARQHVWQGLLWLQAQANVATYAVNAQPGTRIVGIKAVLYNGSELRYASEAQLDRLTPSWEMQRTGPKWWTTDNTESPTVIRIHPPPLVTGSAVPIFPADPLPQRWQDNLVLVVAENPQVTIDLAEPLTLLEVFADPVVYETVARLAGGEGEFQALAVSAVAQALAQFFRQRLGMSS
jgi:hypothetical protein